MNIPSREKCLDILTKNKTPSIIIEHTKEVCKVAEDIAEKLLKKGMKLNKELVTAASLLHDIERAKDNHIIEGANLLKSLGYPEVSEVIRKHSLYKLKDSDRQPRTIEEKIVFYADKRVNGNKIVSLKERFDALEKKHNVDLSKELEFAKKIEEELITLN